LLQVDVNVGRDGKEVEIRGKGVIPLHMHLIEHVTYIDTLIGSTQNFDNFSITNQTRNAKDDSPSPLLHFLAKFAISSPAHCVPLVAHYKGKPKKGLLVRIAREPWNTVTYSANSV